MQRPDLCIIVDVAMVIQLSCQFGHGPTRGAVAVAKERIAAAVVTVVDDAVVPCCAVGHQNNNVVGAARGGISRT